MKLTTDILLLSGLALATLGMILVVLAVISGGLFLAGVVLLLIGMLVCAGAGIFGVVRNNEHA